jgi:BirA family biotin operon repressor/biotin-[acetyl-CoA-carboxylase] ligase
VSDTTLPWDTAGLQQALQASLAGLQVQALARIGSTNTHVLDLLRRGAAPALLVVAESQTQGRGRNGRAWQSQPGASLTFSLGLPLAPVDWSGLSLAVGTALADAIDPAGQGAPRLQLKWPNDLWLREGADHGTGTSAGGWRKLGGILVETVATGSGGRSCVVGVGLNVQPCVDVQGLASGYACVHELDPLCTAPALLARVALPLLHALRRFERDGLAPFAAAFAHRDLLCGRRVSTTQADLPQGVADGVDASGALRVRHAGGVALVHSGEVSVRPAAEPAEA